MSSPDSAAGLVVKHPKELQPGSAYTIPVFG